MLVAYAKLALKADLLPTRPAGRPVVPVDAGRLLPGADPRAATRDQLASHPLRREIITNSVVNSMVNRGGITFAFRATEETGATPEQVARAFVVCREVFDLSSYVAAVEDARQRRPHRRPDRALPRVPPAAGPLGALVPAEPPGLARRRRRGRAVQRRSWPSTGRTWPNLLQGERAPAPASAGSPGWRRPARRPRSRPARPGCSTSSRCWTWSRSAARPAATPARSRRSTSRLSEQFGIDGMLTRVTRLPRDDRWDALARGALRDDLYAVLEALTSRCWTPASPARPRPSGSRSGPRPTPTRSPGPAPRSSGIERIENPGIAALSVALRTPARGHPQRVGHDLSRPGARPRAALGSGPCPP